MMKHTPWPIAILIASFLCPTELSLYLGGLRLPPHRVALIILLPIAVYRLLTRKDIRARLFDWVVISYNVATVVVFNQHGIQFIGPDLIPSNGLVFGGSLALESTGGYLVARAWVRDIKQFRAAVRFLVASVLIAGLIALPDTLLGQHFTHDLLQSLTGYVHPRDTEQRIGLTRAYGTCLVQRPGGICALWSRARNFGRDFHRGFLSAAFDHRRARRIDRLGSAYARDCETGDDHSRHSRCAVSMRELGHDTHTDRIHRDRHDVR